ncbi:hypothetical protein UFOVP1563_1, partial [uncultured Caudovirales phage]
MAVPYTFATQTTSIPLAQLDTNFSTPVTIGTTIIPLGNIAPILENVTLGNVVIASGNVTLTNVNVINATITQATITTANVTTANITSAFITTANVTTANITTANVVTIRATTANIATANVTAMEAVAANVTTLRSTNINVTTANATTAYITTANVATANVTAMEAVSANVTTIRSTTANLTTANVTTLIASVINVATANVTTLITAGITDSGNLTFTGTGNRITGDFSNATVASRLMFQNSASNSASRLGLLPNGTSTSASWDALNNSDPTNASLARFGVTSTDARFESSVTGTGTALPMTFYTGGSERARIDTSGNVGIGVTSTGGSKVAIGGSGLKNQFINTDATNTYLYSDGNAYFGSTGAFFNAFITNNTERMRISSSGNVGINNTNPADTLDVVGNIRISSASLLRWVDAGTVRSSIQGDASSNLIISTASTERMRIDSTGAKVSAGSLTGSYGTGGITTNFAAGDAALVVNTTGAQNTAVGVNALDSNLDGSFNSAFGRSALESNTSGGANTAFGQFALSSVTTAGSGSAFGQAALRYNTGANNTAVGGQALQGTVTTSTGGNNSALGYQALIANTSGALNTAIGYLAGSAITSGSNNTLVGAYTTTPGGITGANWTVLSDGQANVKLAIDTNSAIWAVNGQPFFNQAAPTAKTGAATLTGAELLTGIITYNGIAASLTMPLGSALDTAI